MALDRSKLEGGVQKALASIIELGGETEQQQIHKWALARNCLTVAKALKKQNGASEETDPRVVAWERLAADCQDLGGLEAPERMILAGRGLRLCQSLLGKQAKAAVSAAGDSPLQQGTTSLTGIGPKMAERLAERGLQTVEDLLWLIPRRYDDVRRVVELSNLLSARKTGSEEFKLGERATVRGEIDSVRFVRRGPRGWIDLRMKCEVGSMTVRWFGARAGMCNRYPEGGQVILAGKISERSGNVEMTNPDVLAVEDLEGVTKVWVEGIVPQYSAIPGVPAGTLRKACQAAALRGSSLVSELLPAELVGELGLSSLGEALRILHLPSDQLDAAQVDLLCEGRSPWHRRLAFEELFVLALIVAIRRQHCRSDVGKPYAIPKDKPQDVLPFSLTGAQTRVAGEIADDLRKKVPMNRLLQGDVGSGKTAVAFCALVQVAKAGGQVALMAPTTILAEQHLRSLAPWCEKIGLRIRLLTANTSRAIRSSTLALLGAGKIDLVVGTHALLSEEVNFRQLGLVIVDEQHRFGVAQRALLRAKAIDYAPHLLVMTATPIPRTLALTAYGELDVSILDEMPPGREPPRTQILEGEKGRNAAYRALAKRIELGQRAYIVCPMVEPLEDPPLGRTRANACELAAELSKRFGATEVALVHGRLSVEDRDAAMDAFRTGQAKILVATTVIEVGVDVPEAIVILIEDADHFGLAQLHQLRGRVGRGGGSSECVLLTSGSASEEGRERLEIMVATNDGFVISEEDLRMRGPGELLGQRQAGLPRLRFGDLREHTDLLLLAKERAEKILTRDPKLQEAQHAGLRIAVANHEATAYGSEGG